MSSMASGCFDAKKSSSFFMVRSGNPIRLPNSSKSLRCTVLTSESCIPSLNRPLSRAKIRGTLRCRLVFIRSYAGARVYSPSPRFISEKFFRWASSLRVMKLNTIILTANQLLTQECQVRQVWFAGVGCPHHAQWQLLCSPPRLRGLPAYAGFS